MSMSDHSDLMIWLVLWLALSVIFLVLKAVCL